MLFNSFNFLVFFCIVILVYYGIPKRWQWVWLLFASLFFYMAWNPPLVLLLLFSVFINYGAALLISRTQSRAYLIICMLINFGLLFVFKYLNFFSGVFLPFFSKAGIYHRAFSIILPMGISFYTFQAASYTIDVYRKRIKPERNFAFFTLFITFFPQLVAGPIERTDKLLPQLKQQHAYRFENLLIGSKRMAFGFFKKVVIADRAAVIVNTVFSAPASFGGLHYMFATVMFAFQIYCDFSGYSEIALGCAKCLGIDLMENFDRPYFSKSIKEFWRRWHISLSSWFKDYVYIPLGGSRVSKGRFYLNTFITFMISGLWHGANWTFIIWGALHGIYQILGHITQGVREKAKKALGMQGGWFSKLMGAGITFTLVCFAYIFFRADSIGDALYVLTHLPTGIRGNLNRQGLYDVINSFGLNLMELLVVGCAILVLMLTEFAGRKENIHSILNRKPVFLRWGFYYGIVLSILLFGVYYDAGQFIYFQF